MFNQQIREMLERVSDAFVAFDREWHYVYINTKAEEIFEQKRAEVLGRTWLEVTPYAHEFVLFQKCQDAMKTQQPGQVTFFSPMAKTWLKASYYPSSEGLMIYFADQTAQKMLEETQLRSETRIRRLIDANLIGIIFWNMDGAITDANDVFLTMLGYTREDIQARHLNWRMITPPEYAPIDEKALEEIRILGEVKHPFEKVYLHKDGREIPVILGAAMLDHSEEEGVAFVLDISERKELERMKDDFISMASHELKTPVTSIKAFTQVLLKRLHGSEDRQALHMLSRMEVQLNRLTRLINELLDLSQMQEGEMLLHITAFDLCDLVVEVRDAIQQMTQLELVVEGKQPLPVMGDRERLEQVFTNLLNNAIKYSARDKKILILIERNGDEAAISVQDFGIGIDEGQQKKIFERFYRVNGTYERTFPGLGIGLFISQTVVHRHKGNIEVKSRKGEGATFTVHLPLSLPRAS
jgi:PAS domain S-box-containing protein